MTPSQPYLIRAMYDWIVDNEMTPHILVEASDQVQVPREFVEDDKIVLNIGPMAVQALELGQDAISFEARFAGKTISIRIPVKCVSAIYARENGQGMMFPEGDDSPPEEGPAKSERPHLQVVK